MRVLIVKTSSMGDIIHTLPALTDAGKAIPGISFDWVVEENFAEIPAWHPLVKNVIPIAWRRWRKQLFSAATRAEWRQFRERLQASSYDVVLDAQGLIKSALFARMAKGVHAGPDWRSAREPWAALLYQRRFPIVREQHAIKRLRSLFSQALGYEQPDSVPDYGIDRGRFLSDVSSEQPYLVFLHGTTWATKHWPETHWLALAKLANQNGFAVKLPWGTATELERAERIAAQCEQVEVLPKLDLLGAATVIAGAKAIVAVDTGLGHLAAALDVPTLSLYGPTDPLLTGALGRSQVHLAVKFPCAPCFGKLCTYPANPPTPQSPQCLPTLLPVDVWGALITLL
jgi:heptosyltransferase-1